jgi:hypothetical protein
MLITVYTTKEIKYRSCRERREDIGFLLMVTGYVFEDHQGRKLGQEILARAVAYQNYME